MTPDFQRAATKAAEILIKYGINTAPISPLPIFKHSPGVLVLSFAEISNKIGIERKNLITMFGERNQDAVTSVQLDNGHLLYIVAYNQRLPLYMVQRSLARELGHIVLEHDGSRPEDVRAQEAICFAQHLLCPRPLIKALQESNVPLTTGVFGNVTGCDEMCLSAMRKTPGVEVPAELNRKIKEQFKDYICNFLDYQSIICSEDETPLADFGTYMLNYKE